MYICHRFIEAARLMKGFNWRMAKYVIALKYFKLLILFIRDRYPPVGWLLPQIPDTARLKPRTQNLFCVFHVWYRFNYLSQILRPFRVHCHKKVDPGLESRHSITSCKS